MYDKLSEWSYSDRMLDIPASCRSVFECKAFSYDAFNLKGNATTGAYRGGGGNLSSSDTAGVLSKCVWFELY